MFYTVYARWSVESYTVTFDVRGGNETIDAQTVEYNGILTKPTDPTKEELGIVVKVKDRRYNPTKTNRRVPNAEQKAAIIDAMVKYKLVD